MFNDSTSPHRDLFAQVPPTILRMIGVCVVGAALVGCNEGSDTSSAGDAISNDAQAAEAAGPASFDVSLEESPCDIMPAELVAKTFDVPAAEIEATSALSSNCSYEWEGDGGVLNVSLDVDVFESTEDAADNFRSVTRGMSAEEVSSAMEGVTDQAREEGDLDTQAKQDAAESISEGLFSGGLEFQDVEGVADQARFGTSFGTLYLVRDNLKLGLTAYHGPGMTMPAMVPGETASIMEALEAWQNETMPARKRQSVELAKAVMKSL